MTLFKGTGTVLEIKQEEGRIKLKIANCYYSIWSKQREELDEVMRNIHVDDIVSFSYTEKENPGRQPYRNIQSIEKDHTAQPTSTAQTSTTTQRSTEENITRSVALKAAVECSKAQWFYDLLTKDKDPTTELLLMAERLNSWLSKEKNESLKVIHDEVKE